MSLAIPSSSRSDLLGRLPQLQNLIKQDPEGYRGDFLMQYRHYESEHQIFLLQPSKSSEHFNGLITFLSHICRCYPEELKNFPNELMELIANHYNILEANLRKTIVQNLILMRNRDLIEQKKELKKKKKKK